MRYDEFYKLKVGDTVEVEIFRFQNYHPVKSREIVQIKFKSENTAHIEFNKKLIEYHFSQIKLP